MTAALVGWLAVAWCVAAVLVAAAFGCVRRRYGRHTPDRDTATLPDLIATKETPR